MNPASLEEKQSCEEEKLVKIKYVDQEFLIADNVSGFVKPCMISRTFRFIQKLKFVNIFFKSTHKIISICRIAISLYKHEMLNQCI